MITFLFYQVDVFAKIGGAFFVTNNHLDGYRLEAWMCSYMNFIFNVGLEKQFSFSCSVNEAPKFL